MKNSWTFTIVTAVTLAVTAVAVCFLLMLFYSSCLNILIGLEGILFPIFVAPAVLILSIPFTLFMRWQFNHKGKIPESKQFRTICMVGAVFITLILAVIYPCHSEPYFVGGYLLKFIGWW